MKVAFSAFALDDVIPVLEYVKDRKLVKYFSRETAAAIVCCGKLHRTTELFPRMPVYYATGITEHEEYGLPGIAMNSGDSMGRFSPELFVQRGFRDVPPITQFKLLCNMPLCFLSLNFGLEGDNAVIYAEASGLLCQALSAPVESTILLGAGKTHANGTVEAGFAVVSKEEIAHSPHLTSSAEAVEIFREWMRSESP